MKARPIQRWLFYAAVLLLVMGLLPGASSGYPASDSRRGEWALRSLRGRALDLVQLGRAPDACGIDPIRACRDGWRAKRSGSWRGRVLRPSAGLLAECSLRRAADGDPDVAAEASNWGLLGGLVALNFFLLAQLAAPGRLRVRRQCVGQLCLVGVVAPFAAPLQLARSQLCVGLRSLGAARSAGRGHRSGWRDSS